MLPTALTRYMPRSTEGDPTPERRLTKQHSVCGACWQGWLRAIARWTHHRVFGDGVEWRHLAVTISPAAVRSDPLNVSTPSLLAHRTRTHRHPCARRPLAFEYGLWAQVFGLYLDGERLDLEYELFADERCGPAAAIGLDRSFRAHAVPTVPTQVRTGGAPPALACGVGFVQPRAEPAVERIGRRRAERVGGVCADG